MSEVDVKDYERGNPKEEFDDYESYKNYFSDLVELERKEEMERHESEIKNLSAKERESEGRALLGLRFKEEKQGLGGSYILKFSRNHSFPDNEISVGDLVMISKNEPLNSDNPTGTVTKITNYAISVSFDSKPHGFVYSKGLRIDLYVNDITFQRMLDAIGELENSDFRDILLGDKDSLVSKDSEEDLDFYNEKLNFSQKKSVKDAISCEDFFLIHGPPGTGKTTTLVEIIEQNIDRGNSVLATADSNAAVDNLVEFLVNRGRDVVRVGHPARVTDQLTKHTLDSLVEETEEYSRSQELWDEVSELNKKQENYTYPSGRWRRGLDNKDIKELAKKGDTARGIPPEKIKSMASWLKIEDSIGEKVDEAKNLEEKGVEKVLDNAEVVCATNSTSGSELLEDKKFGLVTIDEATQATEPSCLIPLNRASKVVLAGDHKQLPPTILNKDAKDKGLSQTLFERLLEVYGDDIRRMLKVQYRMNKQIMDFPNNKFYGGELVADDSVADHTISDLVNNEDLEDAPIVFFDTNGKYPEKQREGSTSRENLGEARKVKNLVKDLLNHIKATDIGVITPYNDQVDLLEKKLPINELEINSVDGFQGREKEIIILSLVRSNERNELGFLSDYRRLNVSITRAKRKLIIIGDSRTLKSDMYRDMIDYVQKNGKMIEK